MELVCRQINQVTDESTTNIEREALLIYRGLCVTSLISLADRRVITTTVVDRLYQLVDVAVRGRVVVKALRVYVVQVHRKEQVAAVLLRNSL